MASCLRGEARSRSRSWDRRLDMESQDRPVDSCLLGHWSYFTSRREQGHASYFPSSFGKWDFTYSEYLEWMDLRPVSRRLRSIPPNYLLGYDVHLTSSRNHNPNRDDHNPNRDDHNHSHRDWGNRDIPPWVDLRPAPRRLYSVPSDHLRSHSDHDHPTGGGVPHITLIH